MDETPLEASPEDVADQRAEAVRVDVDDLPTAEAAPVPWDADPADYSEQHAEVPLDEDDRV